MLQRVWAMMMVFKNRSRSAEQLSCPARVQRSLRRCAAGARPRHSRGRACAGLRCCARTQARTDILGAHRCWTAQINSNNPCEDTISLTTVGGSPLVAIFDGHGGSRYAPRIYVHTLEHATTFVRLTTQRLDIAAALSSAPTRFLPPNQTSKLTTQLD
eukprot:SAG11_NODE_2481_length_3305_cov_2.704304_3_plen_158_part_00